MSGDGGTPRDPGLGKTAETFRKSQPYVDAVWQLIGGTLLGLLAGWGLDRWLGTRPWLMISLLLLGMIAGFVGFFRSVSRVKP